MATRRYIKYPGRGPTRRVTVYLEKDLHAWLKLKAAATDYTVSGWVNDMLRREIDKETQRQERQRREAAEADREIEELLKKLSES